MKLNDVIYICDVCKKGFTGRPHKNKKGSCPFCYGVGHEKQGHHPFVIKEGVENG